MQCASAIFSSVACPVLQYFSTLSHKGHDFRKKKVVEYKMCALIFSAPFVRNISHSKKNFSVVFSQMCIRIHVKNQSFLLDSNKTGIFSIDFRKILKYNISGQSVRWQPRCSVRTDGWRTDRRADTTKLRVTFRNFVNGSKSWVWNTIHEKYNSFTDHTNARSVADAVDVGMAELRHETAQCRGPYSKKRAIYQTLPQKPLKW
jgi:hypothetical protein